VYDIAKVPVGAFWSLVSFLFTLEEMIPIIVISFNNYKYVENTIKQLLTINPDYQTSIIIMDNCSTDTETIDYLKRINVKVHYNKTNVGPWVQPSCNSELYNEMPNEFILTDPDLQFNKHLPANFIEILSELSKKYKCRKIGFALDISDYDKMYQDIYYPADGSWPARTILDWEGALWSTKISNETYDLYVVSIDTTFCLINKEFNNHEIYQDIRVGGNFIAKHLPWYVSNPIYNKYEEYCFYTNSKYSWTKRIFMSNLEKDYTKIHKRGETLFIKNGLDNLSFWENVYESWENDTFNVFDTYLRKDKIFIDIGGWIGTTAMYGCRKSKHVYVVEADNKSFSDLQINCSTNCTNYTLIQRAIYNEDNVSMVFGKNKHLSNSKLNDSTSQLYTEIPSDSNDYYYTETITLRTLLKDINPDDISLIKVDIEGGEEHILQDLYYYHSEHKLKVYVSFHYSWWTDKNLDRFSFLTPEQKVSIRKDPFISILF
jgi:FkbM family methyltransferase